MYELLKRVCLYVWVWMMIHTCMSRCIRFLSAACILHFRYWSCWKTSLVGIFSYKLKKASLVTCSFRSSISAEKRQFKSKWIWDNLTLNIPSSKGSKLLFPVIKANKIKISPSHFLSVDWCCFYYFLRNSLVALLEALFARIFLDLRYRCDSLFLLFFISLFLSFSFSFSASPSLSLSFSLSLFLSFSLSLSRLLLLSLSLFLSLSFFVVSHPISICLALALAVALTLAHVRSLYFSLHLSLSLSLFSLSLQKFLSLSLAFTLCLILLLPKFSFSFSLAFALFQESLSFFRFRFFVIQYWSGT